MTCSMLAEIELRYCRTRTLHECCTCHDVWSCEAPQENGDSLGMALHKPAISRQLWATWAQGNTSLLAPVVSIAPVAPAIVVVSAVVVVPSIVSAVVVVTPIAPAPFHLPPWLN